MTVFDSDSDTMALAEAERRLGSKARHLIARWERYTNENNVRVKRLVLVDREEVDGAALRGAA